MAAKPPLQMNPSPSEAAALTSTDQAEQDSQNNPVKKAKRTFLTQHACARCRQKKSKCDGKRPVCQRCEKHGADCVYDVAQEGMTRMQSLQSQLTSMTDEHERLKQLFEALKRSDDQESTTLLAKLRMGDSIDDLLSYLGESDPGSSSGQQTRSPVESHQGHDYSRWPTSPANQQDGYWKTPSQPSSRTSSQTAISQLANTDPALSYQMQDGQGGYYQTRSPHDAQQPGQPANFSASQWQHQEQVDGVSPYYAAPPTSHPAQGKHSRPPDR